MGFIYTITQRQIPFELPFTIALQLSEYIVRIYIRNTQMAYNGEVKRSKVFIPNIRFIIILNTAL